MTGDTAPVPATDAARPGWWTRLSRSPWRAVIGAAAGVGVAVAYALAIGCRTGQCPLTSNPLHAGVFGAFVGALMGWPDRTQRSR